jgi:HEXXH motif-containing protein
VREYRLTDEQFRSLGGGAGAPDAISLLADAQLSRRRLFLLAAAERLAVLPAELRDALDLVIRIDRACPAAGRDLLRYPFLGTWFARLAPELVRTTVDEKVAIRAAEGLGSLAAATAISAGITFEIILNCAGPDLVFPGLGTATGVGPGRVSVSCDGTTVTIAHGLTLQVPCGEFGPGWRPAHHVRLTSHVFEIIDADPLRDRFPEPPRDAMPHAVGAALDRLVLDAWQLLEEDQPAHAAAMRIALRALVPLRTPANGTQVSASVRGCFGAIGLSIPDDPQTLAELLVHEFQHEKLGALLDLVDLCTATGGSHFHAPWRPDPRPAAALMQGVYAFTGVAGFWRARRVRLHGVAEEAACARYFSWRDHVSYALDQLLRSGELTAQGDRFCHALAATIAMWESEAPTPPAVRLSTTAAHVSWRDHRRTTPADVDGTRSGSAPNQAE